MLSSQRIINFGFSILFTSCGNGICDQSLNGKCAIDPATLSCPVIESGNSTTMTTALSTITTHLNTADTITSTLLTIPGDSYSTTSGGATLRVDRTLVATPFNSGSITIGSYTTEINVPAAVFTGSSATAIDHGVFTYTTNILSDYYAPSGTWHSPLVAYREVDSSSGAAVEFVSLNTSGNPITVTLPCDTSSCTTQCSCQCYQWNFTSNRWTRSSLTTTQTSATTVSCSSYLPKAYLSVFAVNNGCE